MKKLALIFGCASLCMTMNAHAQLDKKVQSDKSIRNSVCLMMMEDASVPQKELLRAAFMTAECPAKYNDHNVGQRVIDPTTIVLCDQDKEAFNLCCLPTNMYLECKSNGTAAPKQTVFNENMNQVMRDLMQGTTKTIDTVIKLNVARLANRYLAENKVAQQLADKWFLNEDGSFDNDLKLLCDRAQENASEADKEIAAASQIGRNKIMREIGYEMINNTFVVVTRFGYKAKDDLIADIILPMKAAAQFDPTGYAGMGIAGAETAMKMSMGQGYYVTVDSYLFQLRWNENIETQFNNLWDADGTFNAAAYSSGDLFSLQFIGNEREWTRTKAGIFSDKSESDLILMAAIDAVDLVLAKFERKYDQFKTKTPLIVKTETDKKGREIPVYSARLGTKDGLSGGEVFEVLEKVVVMDKDSVERVKYEKRGELSVNKKQIWDNSYSTAQELALSGAKQEITETQLLGKGKNSYYEGLLLRMKSTKK